MSKRRPQQQDETLRSKWFHFGPGIAIAILLSGFILYTRWADGMRREPPRIERTVLGAGAGTGDGISPEISVLLDRRKELRLSGDQVKKIERLQYEWERVSRTQRQEANLSAGRFRVWMDEAQKRGRVSIRDIQEHGMEMSTLSARIARQRHAYWNSALQILSPEQRRLITRSDIGNPVERTQL